ncbi:MAG: aminoglycoside phosphotransferase (APT) family kinase protein [Ilumatobacter sp.]|jgi:aminoglycoside phosphotransferase (APT) family kinase protein
MRITAPAASTDGDRVSTAFEQWLSASGFSPHARVVDFRTPQSTGSGDIIWFVTVETANTNAGVSRSEWVLRLTRKSSGLRSPSLAVETMSALAGLIGVPRVLAIESDPTHLGSEFVVTERLRGRVAPDHPPYTFHGWLRDSPVEEQESIWWSAIEQISRLHRIDIRMPNFAYLFDGRAAVGCDDALSRLAPLAGDLPDGVRRKKILRLMTELTDRLPEAPTRHWLSWGDCRLPNMVVEGDSVVGLLDFEDVGVDDPMSDLATWLLQDEWYSKGLGLPRLPGFPSHAETIERYAELSGHEIRDLEWWRKFTILRFSLTRPLR